MANFIYDEKQERPVNLDQVQSIYKRDRRPDYVILFEVTVPSEKSYMHASVARWVYQSQEERDYMHDKILSRYATRLDDPMPVVA